MAEAFGETAYSNSGYLAIDDISLGHSHNYLPVVLAFITGRVLSDDKARRVKILANFFTTIPTNGLANIDAIAMDMWDPVIKSVKHWC